MKFNMKLAERDLLERLCTPLVDADCTQSRADIDRLVEQTRIGRTRDEIDREIADVVRRHFTTGEHHSLIGLCADLSDLVEEPPLVDPRVFDDLGFPKCPVPPPGVLHELGKRFDVDPKSGLSMAWRLGWVEGAKTAA